MLSYFQSWASHSSWRVVRPQWWSAQKKKKKTYIYDCMLKDYSFKRIENIIAWSIALFDSMILPLRTLFSRIDVPWSSRGVATRVNSITIVTIIVILEKSKTIVFIITKHFTTPNSARGSFNSPHLTRFLVLLIILF